MVDAGERRRVEDVIFDKVEQVDFTQPDAGWLQDDRFIDLIRAFDVLVKHYADSGDTNLDADVLHLYHDITSLLKRVYESDRIPDYRRNIASEARQAFTQMLDEIMEAIERNVDMVRTPPRGDTH